MTEKAPLSLHEGLLDKLTVCWGEADHHLLLRLCRQRGTGVCREMERGYAPFGGTRRDFGSVTGKVRSNLY